MIRLLTIFITLFFTVTAFGQVDSYAFDRDNDFKKGIEVTFKPNPINNSAQIEIKGLKSYDYNFMVFDITGRLVRQYMNQTQNIFVFDREDLQQGFYFYKIIDNGKEVTAGRFQILD